ncbi:MAG: hypothetical protein LIP02_07945 [Bacteroidales bacterium]|nr:hypothetical protein [Bacteroidales bacterium]
MEENSTKNPAVAAEQPVAGNPCKSKEELVAKPKDAATVLDYLRLCRPFEADSIRIIADLVLKRGGDIATLTKSERLHINRFINAGFYREPGATREKLLAHRQRQSRELMAAMKPFVTKDEILVVCTALMELACDPDMLSFTFDNLKEKPAEPDSTTPNGNESSTSKDAKAAPDGTIQGATSASPK